MSTTRPPTRWHSVRSARRQVERWRSGRRRGGGAAAWARLLDLAGAGALGEPTCVSGADHRTTRSSLRPPASRDRGGQPAAATFVEFSPVLPAHPSECTIEVVEPSGRKLTVSLRGAPGSDLVALTQSLWGTAR